MFPRPPLGFTDKSGRSIEIRTHEDGERDPLVAMYDALDDEDRAQGLPPATTEGIRSWLDDILDDGLHVVAWHEDLAVGHACLLPAGESGHELAIFVRSSYQHARIGTRLLRSLLGYGQESGVGRVWLTVRRDNIVARNLYESAGFERVEEGTDPFASDVTMARWL